ncbi:peptide synthetase [Halomicronema hongdechloris C2206]|uniref:Peptide synthetase n=1 Tax=Halomicronema hongdechloris C2206 TaxID=1641165 RepID=A0A1Z3HJU1_9CYAN|nr:non-ribosomal peptide synthetase [Halomicronema hongdechloris]ASC70570.1 peptide synthetase [Halomicronema hongdechloris C2206]
MDSYPYRQPTVSYPLSPNQKLLWLAYQLAPDSPAYNIYTTALIKGAIDTALWQDSWKYVVKTHPILRATYRWHQAEPEQVIHAATSPDLTFKVIHASELSEEEVRQYILAESRDPFRLETGPTLKVCLFQRAPQIHIQLVTIHEISGELRSLSILLRKFLQRYSKVQGHELSTRGFKLSESSAFTEGYLSHSATTIVQEPSAKHWQYPTYINWQAELLSTETGIQLGNYWENYLADSPVKLELPIDYPRPLSPSYHGDVYLNHLEATEVTQIKGFSKEHNASLFVILLANFYALLSRICQQENLSVGIPLMSSWLDEERSNTVLGMLANLVLCRLNLTGKLSFREMLERVAAAIDEVAQHRDYPFLDVANYFRHKHKGITESLPVQVSFSWEADPYAAIGDVANNLSIQPYPMGEQGGGAFDLYLTVMEVEDYLQLCWKYSTDVFSRETVARVAQQFKALLMAAIAEPDRPFTQLSLLSKADQSRLLTAQSQAHSQLPQQCIHQLIERQVERTPDNVAVVFKQDRLTYAELNQAANQLAHYLQSLGIGPDTLVGIFMPRCLDMMIGLLGILKAGAAYVPIDPTYPQERLAHIFTDCQPSTLLVHQQCLVNAPDTTAHIIALDAEWPTIASHSIANPLSQVTARNLAYVIYTSGSTGKPKGVMIEHRSLVNFVQQACQTYDITSADRILQFSSFSFDAAIEEIYTCLVSGGTLFLRPENMMDSIPTFLETCQDYELTVLDLPTAYWHLLVEVLVEQPKLSLPSSLRCIIIGGERANPYYVKQWQRYLGISTELINTYGPTEATVVATTYQLPHQVPMATNVLASTEIPIGKALGNIETYVLDEQQQLVPFGLSGELYLGGIALARGYLNAPDLTQRSFILNPFGSSSNDRLYKTGDLVRYLPDGNLEFLGRVDQQVKIRGFRVDPGEIESAITTYPEVRQALVIAQSDHLGHQQLTAYIVSNLIPDRIPYQTECWLDYAGKSAKLETVDISSLGIGLSQAPPELSQGDSVRVRFPLPGRDDERWFSGQVIWNHASRVGIALHPTTADQALLQKSAAHLLESQGILQALQRTVAGALRKYLKQKLPDYMIPASFILINALPLTPNGKVDKRQLPPPYSSQLKVDEPVPAFPHTPTEQSLAEIWSTLLGVKQVTLEDNFFELGGNSLLAIQFVNCLSERLQIDIPVWLLLKNPTISTLASAITEQTETNHVAPADVPYLSDFDLKAEANLDPNIHYPNPIDFARAISPASILLTGPTGFVGPYLLSELLMITDADIYCLVRHRAGTSSKQRLEDHLKSHGLWHQTYRHRIIPVVGDLSKPYLGLSEPQFEDLAQSIDVIYHNGAWVNFMYPYSALKSVNVLGTQEVLRLAGYTKTKPVHFISTLSVFSDAYVDRSPVLETETPQFEETLKAGYDQTKWVAENLVKAAQSRGLPITIHRLGTLLGNSQTGIINKPNDFFVSLVKGCLQLGKAPNLVNNLNLTPIDYVSKAVVSISQDPNHLGQTFHITHPQAISWTQLIDCIQANGYHLELCPYPLWLSQLKTQIEAGYPNDLATFLSTLSSEDELPLEKAEFDSRLSKQALSKLSLVCPEIDNDLIGRYLGYLVESGGLQVKPS